MKHKKEINLIPVNSKIKHRKIKPGMVVIAGAVILASIYISIGLRQQNKINELHTESERIKLEIYTLGFQDKNIKMAENTIKRLEDLREVISIIKEEKLSIVVLMNELKQYVPSNIRLVSLSLANVADLSVDFETSSPYDTALLITRLNESGMFEEVVVESLPLDDRVNTVSFNLKLKNNDTEFNNNPESKSSSLDSENDNGQVSDNEA